MKSPRHPAALLDAMNHDHMTCRCPGCWAIWKLAREAATSGAFLSLLTYSPFTPEELSSDAPPDAVVAIATDTVIVSVRLGDTVSVPVKCQRCQHEFTEEYTWPGPDIFRFSCPNCGLEIVGLVE